LHDQSVTCNDSRFQQGVICTAFVALAIAMEPIVAQKTSFGKKLPCVQAGSKKKVNYIQDPLLQLLLLLTW